VAKEVPTARPKETSKVVEVEDSNVYRKSENAGIIDFVQTMKPNNDDVSKQNITEKI
jgi:hypothetical protein